MIYYTIAYIIYIITVQKFVPKFRNVTFFELLLCIRLLILNEAALFDQKYSKNNMINALAHWI